MRKACCPKIWKVADVASHFFLSFPCFLLLVFWRDAAVSVLEVCIECHDRERSRIEEVIDDGGVNWCEGAYMMRKKHAMNPIR